MASPTPYHDWIRYLIDTGYPNLKFLDEKVMHGPEHTDATCTLVTFSAGGVLENSRKALDSDFHKALVGKSRRLFILEGISRAYVEKLGWALGIEPEFFAAGLRSVTWEHHDDRSDAVMLPSICRQTRFWTLEYMECILLHGKFRLGRTHILPFGPLLRRLAIRNPKRDRSHCSSVGLASRFVSFWEQPLSNGNFDAVVLADPPLGTRLDFEYDDARGHERVSTKWLPYGGGFVDFAKIDKRKEFARHAPLFPQSRNSSIADTLLWRLKYPNMFILDHDRALGTVLQRLILSQWTLTLAFLRRDFNSVKIERLSAEDSTWSQVKNTVADLESCHALLDRCSHLVRKNLTQLGIPTMEDGSAIPSSGNANSDASLVQLDWKFIWQECKHWVTETDRLVNLRLNNISILDSERSARLAQSSGRIAELGQILLLVYTPAACAYGLLSMGGDFAPGKRLFWIFFAIAVPLSFVTIAFYRGWERLSNEISVRGIRREESLQQV